jgi:twitching motility protein PilT
VRQIIAGVLRGAVSQRLLPRVGGGRVAAVEVMVVTARVADLIRDPNKTEHIKDAIEDGSYHRMQSFQQHLVELVLDELVDIETATAAATNAHDFKIAVEHALKAKARDGADESSEAGDAVGALRPPEGLGGLRLASSG